MYKRELMPADTRGGRVCIGAGVLYQDLILEEKNDKPFQSIAVGD